MYGWNLKLKETLDDEPLLGKFESPGPYISS